MEKALDAAFFVFHSGWIVFNCIGWIWQRTRPWQLVTIALTAVSWFGLGIWYGWGYCPCTDWHWQVRARLGHDDPPSYTQLLIAEFTGIEVTPFMADAVTGSIFAVVAFLGLALNVRDLRRRTRAAREASSSRIGD